MSRWVWLNRHTMVEAAVAVWPQNGVLPLVEGGCYGCKILF